MISLAVVILKLSLICTTLWFLYLLWTWYIGKICWHWLGQETAEALALRRSVSLSQKKVIAQQELLVSTEKQALSLEEKIEFWTRAIEKEKEAKRQFFESNRAEMVALQAKRFSIEVINCHNGALWKRVRKAAGEQLTLAWTQAGPESACLQMYHTSDEQDPKPWIASKRGLQNICQIIANFWIETKTPERHAKEALVFANFLKNNRHLIIQLQAMHSIGVVKPFGKIKELISPSLSRIVGLIFQHKRGNILVEVLYGAVALINVNAVNVRNINIITSECLDEPAQKSIAKDLSKKFGSTADINFLCRPGLGGGFILESNNLFVDMSMWARLMQVRTSFAYFKEFLPSKSQ